MKKLLFYLMLLMGVNAFAQTTAIPDPNFEQALITLGYDTGTPNGFVQTANINTITVLDVSNKNISDLTGIQSFVSLTTLICDNNLLTNLNINALVNLNFISCTSNQITSLNVSSLINLQYLYCRSNQLTTLNVSALVNLKILHCDNNQLSSLNLNSLTFMTEVRCASNQLTTLSLNGLSNLTYLSCASNNLININLSSLVNLKRLYCNYNQLNNLNLFGLNNLILLYCNFNQLNTLDISNLNSLTDVYTGNNLLTSLNVSNSVNLRVLYCFNNQLSSINLNGLYNLNDFRCNNNQITSLNVYGFQNLDTLDCRENQLTCLNIGFTPALAYFLCTSNPNLGCITVDNVGQTNSFSTYYRDATAFYDTSCSSSCSTTPCTTLITPTFTQITPICTLTTVSPLPTTSLNGITGTWSPAFNNVTTPFNIVNTTYTFTPNAGQCATTTTMTLSVYPLQDVFFYPIDPICAGDILIPPPSTSLNGIPGIWSPAFNNMVTTIYTFTPDAGYCAVPRTLIITVNPTNPTFTQVAPICVGDVLLPLSTASLNGITGTWSPAINNTVTTTYTFTPNAGVLCATTTTMTIVVNKTPEVSAYDINVTMTGSCSTFNGLYNLYGFLNGKVSYAWSQDTSFKISFDGTKWVLWSQDITNDTGFQNTNVPTGLFPPTTGWTATQCLPGTMTINFPYYNVTSFCAGATVGDITPTLTNIKYYTSEVGGTALPNSTPLVAGIYYASQTINGCESFRAAVLQITITPTVTPAFTQVAPICSGTALPPLPTTSLNGITGSWSPTLNNLAITTYTFTPNAGQCATTATMTIVVNPQIVPTFSQIGPFCQNSPAPILPATSNNGITGTWSPSLIDTSVAGTFVYMFTPDTGQCAMQTAINITINPVVLATFNAINPITVNSVAPSLPTTSNNGIIGTWFPAVINTSVVGSFVYTFTPDTTIAGQECAIATSITVEISNCVTTTIKSTFWNTTGAPNRYITYQSVVLPTGSTITKYGVEVTNMTSNAVGTFESTATNFRLIDASPLVASYGTSFSVRVKLQINGTWQCYGIAKNVSVPALPPTANLNTYCGQILPTIDKVVYCTVVPLASSYLFEISQITSTGTLTTTYSNTLNNFKLTDLDFNTFPILFNKIYTIRTKVKTMVNGVEVESAWSSPCSITTPPTPPAISMISGCGSVLSKFTLIKCTLINSATDYKFELVSSTGSLLPLIRQTNSFSLSMVTGVAPTTAYTVTPSYKLYGQWYTGTSCIITTTAGPFKSQEATINQQNLANFAVKAYPNPYTENFKLNVTSSLEEILQIKIYDMLGKLVENKETNISDIETLEVGSNYPSGVYNVVVSQGENVQSLRIIKR